MRVLTAMYDSRAEAEQARQSLASAGLAPDHVSIVDSASAGAAGASGAQERQESEPGLWTRIKTIFVADEDRQLYEEGIRRGAFLLTAELDDSQAETAYEVLEASEPVDLDSRESEWRAQGWNESARRTQEQPAGEQVPGEQAQEQKIPVVEERMRVGKRQVERGGVRVRSYVVEEPVHGQVRLREERTEIERRRVNEPLQGSPGGLMEEREIEVTETSEEPVVQKEALVTEEVAVRKRTGERVQDIDETLRHTEVEVDDQRTGEQASAAAEKRESADQPRKER